MSVTETTLPADTMFRPRTAGRKAGNAFFRGLVLVLGLLAVAPFFVIMYHVVVNGAGAINWAFLTQLPRPVGETGGGMVNSIIGTLLIIALSVLLSVPFGILAGVYLSENKRGKLSSATRLLVNVLQSVPSIVIGIVMYSWIVVPIRSFTALAGGIALAVMMLPIVIKSSEEVLNLVPSGLKEGALALGVPYHTTVLRMILPSSLGGILSGVMLAVARIAGETAPLLFTAFGNPYLNVNVLKPVDAIPLMIYNYAKSPYESWLKMAWGASLVLIVIIFLLNIAVRSRRERL